MSLEQPSASSPIPLNDAVKPDYHSATAFNGVSSPQNEELTAPSPAPALHMSRSNRPSRACTIRAAERLQAAQKQAAVERKQKPKKEQLQQQRHDQSPQQKEQCSANSKIITSLVGPPEPAQLSRWSLRSMWELASILNFLHVFRPLLNIQIEFSAEEFETALITPNDTLGDIHMPLLKAIPPITRMALTNDTWITVLCRKLRDWWHWVADGDLPLVASHGVEIEMYKTLDPGIRVLILKALCDIRVEQEDIRNYIDNSLKHGIQLSAFRKERVGGDSQGISYWYEDDEVIGHRLYREIRKAEVKKAKARGSQVISNTTYQWETVATNFEEFQDVSEKLLASKNRTEASLGKKLQNDMLPEIEKVHKRKERLLKKQHRQALLLDNFLTVDGFGPGRALRDRKPVTYTFDDYDKSINEAIKITKRKPPSPEPFSRREGYVKPEASTNGKWDGPKPTSPHGDFNITSSDSPSYDDDDFEEEQKSDPLDRSNRRRQRPQRYSAREFVEAVSDNDPDYDSDDDIVGEAVYDEEYLKKRKKRRKLSSSSEGEGDEEYRWDEENGEDEEEEEEEEDSLSISEESDEPRKFKKFPGRTRRGTKIRLVGELQSGLRRSKRATRNQINYRQYEASESETESAKPEKSVPSDEHSDSSENVDYSAGSQDSVDHEEEEEEEEQQEMKVDQPIEGYTDKVKEEHNQPPDKSSSNGEEEVDKSSSPGQDEIEGAKKRRFLDLNELAPGSGFDDSPNTVMKDDDRDNF